MFSALLIGLAASIQSQTIEIYRGSTVGDERYWAVADTNLDSAEPDKSKGGLFTLEGGKGKTILVKFGNLENVIPNGAKITSATLYLSPSSSDAPEFTSIGAVKKPWGEGPMFAVQMGRPAETAPPKWAATWKQRRSGSVDWQQPGATGPDDSSAIAEAKMELREKDIAITGLAAAVQAMRDRWFENNGFAIQFAGKCEFFSSQAKAGKPRLLIEYVRSEPSQGPDLSVQWLDKAGTGNEATYRATVKNVGSGPAKPFTAQWIVQEKDGAKFEVNKGLAAGEETVIEFKKAYQKVDTDHRLQPLQFRIFPAEPESNSNNDALEIHEDAIPIAFSGAKIAADAMQALAREINDVYFAQSRFSFALDGALERIRLVPSQDQAQFTVDLAGQTADADIIRSLLSMLTGLRPQTGTATAQVDGETIAFSDPFSGISGFGDTRNEALIPTGIPMLYVPVSSPLFDTLPIEPTTLLSGTEVAALNSSLGISGARRQGILWDLPATIILRATDMTGKPLDSAELAFYQVQNGQVPEIPTQTVLTKNGGTVILENRDIVGALIEKDAIHQLKRNPFGQLSANGDNGTILIRAQVNGESEWAWLKAWQLADSFHRGNKAAAIIDVRFNAPSGLLDRTVNLAKGRLLTDKAGSLPAKLSPMVDDDPATSSAFGEAVGDWVEIDLGRDRPIGEVQITTKSGMPEKFDIQTYATGQQPPTEEAWVKDLNFRWTRANRTKKDGTIAYRGPMTRARFIRIINRSGGKGELAEVRVFALKAE